MNLQEARNIIGITDDSSSDEIKKKYRELTKKFHPDVNKESGAEDRFKKINEAYQIVSSGKDTEPHIPQWNTRNASPFHSPFQNISIDAQNITLNTTISFKESIIGSKIDLKYHRKVKCSSCNGHGSIKQNNGCDRCGGNGVITGRQSHGFFMRTCDKCFGRTSVLDCNECKSSGTVEVETSVTVSIPGGIPNEGILRLGGMGNFAGSFANMDQYTDTFLKVNVTPMSGLSLDGINVISNLDISLLEALEGCSKEVNTIDGNKTIIINPKTYNKDIVNIPNMGVNRNGSQHVIINVKYPNNIESLINNLKVKE